MRSPVLNTLAAMALAWAVAPLGSFAEDAATANSSQAYAMADSLVRLREAAGLSVSPSGSYVAFEVRRAAPGANIYESVWQIMRTAGGAPTTIASGGEMPWGLVARNSRPMAVWITLAPRWSPDERWIAYLRRDNGATQIWRSRIDGRHSERVSDDTGDVTDFVWSSDGRAIIFDSGPSRAEQQTVRERERAQGFLFDDRFDPVSSWEPIRAHDGVPDPRCCRVVDLATRHTRLATLDEISRFRTARPLMGYQATPGMALMWTAKAQGEPVDTQPDEAALPPLTRWRKHFADGAAVALAFDDPSLRGANAPVRLFARGAATQTYLRCADPACAGWLSDAWLLSDGEIAFARREGWAFSTFAFYAWRPATGAVRRLSGALDIWYDCDQAGDRLICFVEGSTKPQQLVSLNLRTGAVSLLHDLNPDFDTSLLATAERLEWQSPSGHPDFGYLIRPRGAAPGQALPLVIVQYRARGFLRGGTGDFSPVQAYASAGLAVLVVDRPEDWEQGARVADDNEIERQNFHDLRLRRDIFGALDAEIDRLVARGDVDPHRIGISGLSDGSATAAYALGHSQRFRAASIAGGSWEPILFYMSSPQQRASLTDWGLGAPGGPDDLNWNGLSIARNASAITTPLLIQSADRELGMALEPLVMLQTYHKPVEAYVFSDEDHVMWQPVHRLAMYQRNIDWFRFWLQDYEDPAPAKTGQYRRWRAMRDVAPASH